ncbi:MAG: ATP-binding protein [Acidobacteriota bacterium]|jgi:predicted AAA+ superfamily ATPase|nr:ATP-binding protein [Acidobacteriota bacterium]
MSELEQLKAIILDSQELPLDTGVPRRLDAQAVPGKASICVGVRRSGKSTYLRQKMQQLVDAGVSRKNILSLNFFDDRLNYLEKTGLGIVAEAYFSLFPEKKGQETVYCFFDEIQAIPNWEPFIDRLLRTEKCEIWLTGSSARMLSREIATQMRGRALSWEVFPFSFHEFLDFKEIHVDNVLSTKNRLLVQKAFDEYMACGGFPEVRALTPALRIKIHQEYFHAILFRDLVERYDIAHPRAVVDLARHLIDNIASLYTLNRLTGMLQARGHKASKNVVSDYIEWFEDSYFLFTVKKFDASLNKSNANPKKIYCIDHAIITSVASGILINAGHILENMIFTHLRRFSSHIYYYKTHTNKEVDFLWINERHEKSLIQVCETIGDVKTRKRELAALNEAMQELNLEYGVIVTRNENEEEIISDDGKIVQVIPAWQFLLQFPSVVRF